MGIARFATYESTHEGWDAWLGDKSTRKLANNTYVHRVGDDIAVKYHATDITTYHRDGTITLDTGGWRTATTKGRMHELIGRGLFLSSTDGVWTLSRRVGEWPAPVETVSEYYDGMRFTYAGEMVTAVLVDSGRELKKAKREIRGYVALYTDERIAELVASAIDKGTAGDCWFCGMQTTDGASLGDAVNDVDHLREHVREGYTMATLMANAVKSRGYREPAVILHHAPELVRKAIRAYLVEKITTSHGARPARDGLAEHWA